MKKKKIAHENHQHHCDMSKATRTQKNPGKRLALKVTRPGFWFQHSHPWLTWVTLGTSLILLVPHENGGSNFCSSIPQGHFEDNNILNILNILLATKNKISVNKLIMYHLMIMRSLIISVQNEPKDKRALRLMFALVFGEASQLIRTEDPLSKHHCVEF